MNENKVDYLNKVYFDFQVLKLQIDKKVWPNYESILKFKKQLRILQKDICYLSSINKNKLAFDIIEKYVFNLVVRLLAIERLVNNFGVSFGLDDRFTQLYFTKEIIVSKFSIRKVHFIEKGNFEDSCVYSIADWILQSALYSLLNPYYEGKLSYQFVGFRKGRSVFTALDSARYYLENLDISRSGILCIVLENYFEELDLDVILERFLVPKKVKPLLQRWLKSILVDNKGTCLGKQVKGVVHCSVLSSLIYNVLLYEVLIGWSSQKPIIFEGFSCIWNVYTYNNEIKQNSICRNIISFVDNLFITTTRNIEIKYILQRVEKAVSLLGLQISKEKSQIIDLFSKVKKDFQFSGFQFIYVPKGKIKKGGFFQKNDKITKLKFNKKKVGFFLISIGSREFTVLKEKCIAIIKKLRTKSVSAVITEINFVIKGYINYFFLLSFCCRLKMLEGIIYKMFKKYLLRKFRVRGVRKSVWVLKKFFICKTKRNELIRSKYFQGEFTSPYGLKWHIHVKVSDSFGKKRVLFLVLPTKFSKVLSWRTSVLCYKRRDVPFYLNPILFRDFRVSLFK